MTIPENSVIVTVDPKDFDVRWDNDITYPFFEDEDGSYLFGYGHQDKAEFARLVAQYDISNGVDPEDADYTENDVSHLYAVAYHPVGRPEDEEWRFTWDEVDKDSEGAFPLTVLSR